VAYIRPEKGSRCDSGMDPPLYMGTKPAITTVPEACEGETTWEGAGSRKIHKSEDLPKLG